MLLKTITNEIVNILHILMILYKLKHLETLLMFLSIIKIHKRPSISEFNLYLT
jgi:hypothetical protein